MNELVILLAIMASILGLSALAGVCIRACKPGPRRDWLNDLIRW